MPRAQERMTDERRVRVVLSYWISPELYPGVRDDDALAHESAKQLADEGLPGVEIESAEVIAAD